MLLLHVDINWRKTGGQRWKKKGKKWLQTGNRLSSIHFCWPHYFSLHTLMNGLQKNKILKPTLEDKVSMSIFMKIASLNSSALFPALIILCISFPFSVKICAFESQWVNTVYVHPHNISTFYQFLIIYIRRFIFTVWKRWDATKVTWKFSLNTQFCKK